MMIIRRNADNIILNKDSKKTDFFPDLLNLFSEKGSTYVHKCRCEMKHLLIFYIKTPVS